MKTYEGRQLNAAEALAFYNLLVRIRFKDPAGTQEEVKYSAVLAKWLIDSHEPCHRVLNVATPPQVISDTTAYSKWPPRDAVVSTLRRALSTSQEGTQHGDTLIDAVTAPYILRGAARLQLEKDLCEEDEGDHPQCTDLHYLVLRILMDGGGSKSIQDFDRKLLGFLKPTEFTHRLQETCDQLVARGWMSYAPTVGYSLADPGRQALLDHKGKQPSR